MCVYGILCICLYFCVRLTGCNIENRRLTTHQLGNHSECGMLKEIWTAQCLRLTWKLVMIIILMYPLDLHRCFVVSALIPARNTLSYKYDCRTRKARTLATSAEWQNFSVYTDLSSVFDWNVKQIFVYVTANYSTPSNVSRRGVHTNSHTFHHLQRCIGFAVIRKKMKLSSGTRLYR